MSLTFPFRNGIGFAGCNGQSLENCNQEYGNCCNTPSGPGLTMRFDVPGVKKTPAFFTPEQQFQLKMMDFRPKMSVTTPMKEPVGAKGPAIGVL
jgi:hypothetical protein